MHSDLLWVNSSYSNENFKGSSAASEVLNQHKPETMLQNLPRQHMLFFFRLGRQDQKSKNVHEPPSLVRMKLWKDLQWHHRNLRSFYLESVLKKVLLSGFLATFISKCVYVLFFGMWWCLYLVCVCALRLCSWCDLSLVWADQGRHNRTPSNNRKSNVPPWAISLSSLRSALPVYPNRRFLRQ